MDWGSRITYFGTTALTDKEVSFGIKDRDRTGHIAIIGKNENARAELLARMALQDIERGIGVVILDADGGLAQRILERAEPSAHDRLIFLDPSDGEYPFSWNPLDEFRALPNPDRHAPLSRAIASVYRISLSPLANALAERLLADPNASLVSVYHLVTDEEARAAAFGADNTGRAVFEALLTEHANDVALIIEHGRYVGKDTLARNLLGQGTSKFTLAALASGGILAVDFSRIKMFPTRIAPLVKIFAHAARARSAMAHTPTSLYLHDCLRNFSDDDVDLLFADRGIAITVSDTGVSEEDRPLREKALARCASIIALSPSSSDLPFAEKLLYPYIEPEELAKLDDGEFAVALSIDGVRSRPFFAHLLPAPERKTGSYQDLIAISRNKYTLPRAKVDQLFKKKEPEDADDDDKKDKEGEGGSFSDTFRSIFAKRTAAAAAPDKDDVPESVDDAELSPPPPPKKGKKSAPKAAEVPEEELKRMLYVEPLSA